MPSHVSNTLHKMIPKYTKGTEKNSLHTDIFVRYHSATATQNMVLCMYTFRDETTSHTYRFIMYADVVQEARLSTHHTTPSLSVRVASRPLRNTTGRVRLKN